MATCKYCLGRQEGTQFCWKKNKVINIVNGICSEYDHNFTISIMEKKTFFNHTNDVANLTPKQREDLKTVLREESYLTKKGIGGV